MDANKNPAADTAVNPAMLKAACREFLKLVLPANCMEIQKTEMTHAFYAGAYTAFGLYHSVGYDSISEEQGVETLTSLSDELDRWRFEMETRAKDNRPHPKLDDIP